MSNDLNLPWYSLPYTRDYATVYTTKKEALIATMQAEYAAHIVKCVNAHDGLVENLKKARLLLKHGAMKEVSLAKQVVASIDATLAKAQGDQE